MQVEQHLTFGSYRFKPQAGQLWRGKQEVKLTLKAMTVLRYLVNHAGQVVTRDEIFAAVWADTVVGDAALTTCIQEVRQALRDDARHPRYIETVHRRGFRFIAEVQSPESKVQSQEADQQARDENGLESGIQDSESNGQGFDAVMPARLVPGSPGAGIQEPQALASDDPLWLPASAGVAQFPPTSQNDLGGGRESEAPAPSLQASQPLDVSALPVQRFWSIRSLVFMGLTFLVGTILTVHYLSRSTLSTQDSVLGTQETQLPLPDKPSIVVLPFVNLSEDPKQEYFSDGLTDVLTGHLSQISSLFVIARNSAFTYKGKAVKVQEVSKELGVRYVLQGSVQRTDQRVRITTQLVDATTSYHLWSEQYDRPLQDFFALQDEIVRRIMTTLKLQLTLHEQGYSVHCKHTDEGAWRRVARARAQVPRSAARRVLLSG